MKTKHILAVLSTCLVAVSFSPINFFSQAAPPPPGFTMFDGKEFQFDVTGVAQNVWHLAFTCPTGRNMKITDINSVDNSYGYPYQSRVSVRITRAANSQIVESHFSPWSEEHRPTLLLLSPGDILEVYSDLSSSMSVSITGMLD